jgi:protein ImuA
MPSYETPARAAGRERDPSLIEGLRGRIGALESGGGKSVGAVSLAAELDAHLPGGGLIKAALHEVLAAGAGPATMFAIAAVRATPEPVLWCQRGQALDAGAPCPAGLAALGLDPRRLTVVAARTDADALWVLEEGLRARVTVIGELGAASLTATRRLALAAEAGRALALLLLPDTAEPTPSAAATRWRISSAPSHEDRPRFRAELFRCRGAAPATWLMEARHETHRLAVVAALHDRAARPYPARLAG